VGVGVGVGAEGVEGAEGVDGAAGELFFFFGFGGFFCEGSEPEGLNEASCGGAATEIDLTADGAAVFFVPPLALPIPNAAPNATSAATTPIATSLPGVIRTSCEASRSSGWCS
jgi:hypothetical protein